MINLIKNLIARFKYKREMKKRFKAIQAKDPFIYK